MSRHLNRIVDDIAASRLGFTIQPHGASRTLLHDLRTGVTREPDFRDIHHWANACDKVRAELARVNQIFVALLRAAV